MISLNLLKKYHGLRAKYYSERINMGGKRGFPFFYIILATALIVGPYLGYSYISENVIPFFGRLIGPENPPAEIAPPPAIIPEPNLPAVETKETLGEEPTPESDDAEPQRPPESAEHLKLVLPAVEKEAPKQVTKENVKPAEVKTTPQPIKKKPAAKAEKKNAIIKVATFTLRANAVSLKEKLEKFGHETSVRNIPIALDTYKISYKNISASQLKKMQKAFAEQDVTYTAVNKKNLFDLESGETFIRSRLENISAAGKSLNLSGTIKRGKKKSTAGHQVVVLTEDNKKTIDETIKSLKGIGLHPTLEKTTSR